uniref:SANT domain-containing protein n=1 Tax=Anisakis simplex TaxID=6269 RepID=A0A0M3J4F0_ANISI
LKFHVRTFHSSANIIFRVCDDENPVISRRECDNCAPSNVRAQKRKKGRYCAICDLYFRRMKRPRPYTVPLKQSVDDDEGVVTVDGMGSPPPITGLKTACQKSSSHDCSFTSSHYAKIRQQNLSQWTIDEELEALKGFHRFGKNFKAISELVKTKTPEMIRRFYEDKQSTFRIEYVS